MMNDQINKLKIQQNEIQAIEKKMIQKKKQNDQQIDAERESNEQIMNLKHEFELKIENLKREVLSRKSELESLKQVK